MVSERNRPVDVNKRSKLFLLNTYNIFMKTLEATTQLGGFNQRLTTRQSKNLFPYSGTYWHKDDVIDTFFSSVTSYDGTTAIGLIVGTKTLLDQSIWDRI